MRNEVVERVNHALLRNKWPEYADVLSAVKESSEYVFENAASGTLTCRERSGGAWLHSSQDPLDEARAEAARAMSDGPELYLVLRPGLGYLPLAIAPIVEKRRCGSVILLVEDRLDLLKAVLARVDWAPLLGSRSAVPLLGDPDVTLPAFLERHPPLSVLPMNLLVPPELAEEPRIRALGEKLVSYSETTQKVLEAKLGAAKELIIRRRTRREPPRVLITVPEIGYLATPIADGFRSCGATVELQAESQMVSRNVWAQDWLAAVPRSAPDIVLWMNRPELSRMASQALRDMGIGNVHWSVDSPRRMMLTPGELKMVDVHLCFDETYLNGDDGSAARVSSQLSLGAGLEPLPGCRPSDALWPQRLGPDVTFVGTLGKDRVTTIRERLGKMHPDQLAVLDDIAGTPGDPAAQFKEKTGTDYVGVPCLYIDEVRSTRRRIEILSALPASSLKIFGATEWVTAGEALAACYGGHSVPYGLDLSSFYYHTLINVNVFHEQCINSTNSRVYDVLAAGGFLLTEYRPRIAEEFEIGRHLVTFTTPAEAREKVEYFLAHPSEREAIAREGQRHVLTRHTFHLRCGRILDLARQQLRTG